VSARARELCAAARALARAVDRLAFGPPVSHVFAPLVFAGCALAAYRERYGGSR